MTTLPSLASPAFLLSFDFDGTLHFPGDEPPVPTGFFEEIRRIRQDYGALWGINTGRSMAQTIEGIVESRFPFLPDFTIAREREIHFPNAFGRWLPLDGWNKPCDKKIHALFKKSRKLLKQVRREIEEQTGAQWIEVDSDPAGIVAQSDDEMAWIVRRLEEMTVGEPQLAWQRNSIYLRLGHRDIQKGSSLSHLAGRFGLAPGAVFAIGDSHNDFEMLDPAHAGMVACPANAVPDIQEKVRTHGGLVSRAKHGHGAIEALRHYFPAAE